MAAKRPARRRAAPAPRNQSRAAGAPAPASAAATEAFYDPAKGGPPVSHHGQRSQLGRALPAESAPDAPRESAHVGADIALGETTGDLASDVARIRAMRVPLGSYSQKLALPKRQDYYRHWFNDEPGRIDEALAGGWAHLRDNEGKPLKRVVGRGRDNGALYGFAMEIPLVFWEEDQAAKHRVAQAMLDSVKKSPARSRPGEARAEDRGKFYDPNDSADGPVQVSKDNSTEPVARI